MTQNKNAGKNGRPLQAKAADGADPQARATLEYLRAICCIEESWDSERKCYTAIPRVTRFENGREQGYIVFLKVKGKQINLAFYEHRNSDEIVVARNETVTENAPETGDILNTMADKYDHVFSARFGRADLVAKYVTEQLEKFYRGAHH